MLQQRHLLSSRARRKMGAAVAALRTSRIHDSTVVVVIFVLLFVLWFPLNLYLHTRAQHNHVGPARSKFQFEEGSKDAHQHEGKHQQAGSNPELQESGDERRIGGPVHTTKLQEGETKKLQEGETEAATQEAEEGMLIVTLPQTQRGEENDGSDGSRRATIGSERTVMEAGGSHDTNTDTGATSMQQVAERAPSRSGKTTPTERVEAEEKDAEYAFVVPTQSTEAFAGHRKAPTNAEELPVARTRVSEGDGAARRPLIAADAMAAPVVTDRDEKQARAMRARFQHLLRGVPADARVEYEDRIGFGEFTCASLDTRGLPETFSAQEALNDGYCDCLNGWDEPGTSACAYAVPQMYFYCNAENGIGALVGYVDRITSSFVNDGVCG